MARVQVSKRAIALQQEKRVEKMLKGRRTFNSGAGAFEKGDVYAGDLMIECKTHLSAQKKITVCKDWMDTLWRAALLEGKTPVLWVDNGEKEHSYIVVPHAVFSRMNAKFNTTDRIATHKVSRVHFTLSDLDFYQSTSDKLNMPWAVLFTFGYGKAFVLMNAEHIEMLREGNDGTAISE